MRWRDWLVARLPICARNLMRLGETTASSHWGTPTPWRYRNLSRLARISSGVLATAPLRSQVSGVRLVSGRYPQQEVELRKQGLLQEWFQTTIRFLMCGFA